MSNFLVPRPELGSKGSNAHRQRNHQKVAHVVTIQIHIEPEGKRVSRTTVSKSCRI